MTVSPATAQTSNVVWGWGLNSSGQLGNGTATDSAAPVQALNLSGILAVAAGSTHTLALKSDGTVWSWGSNYFGELGIGMVSSCHFPFTGCVPDAASPVQIPSLAGVIAVAAGQYFSVAVKSDGTVWAWGSNSFGQLGNGNNNDSNVPVQVSTITGAVAVAAGFGHSVALKSDGTAWAWGYNGFGTVGDGTTADRNAPVQVSIPFGATAVTAGQNHTLVLRSDGTVWGWGNNQYGQLATGALTASSLVPVQAIGLNGVVSIAAGGQQSVALKTDGTLAAWGANPGGQLGAGVFTSSSPVAIPGFSGGTAVSATINTITALKTDGTVWAWGTLPFGPATNGPVQMFSGATALGSSADALHAEFIGTGSSGPTLVSIAITPVAASITAGATQQYTATGTYSDSSTRNITTSVTWTSTDSTIATISGAGLASGVKAGGPIIIRATQGSVVSNDASLTVTNVLLSISVTPANASVVTGSNLPYSAIGNYSDGTSNNLTASVTWSSSDPTIASINAGGIATGVKVGSVTIRATLGAIVSNNATLSVTSPLVSIAVTPLSATIVAGATQGYAAIGTYSDGTTQNITGAVVWSASDSTVATINASGVARGIKAGGPVTIRATQGAIVSNDALLTVTNVLVSITVTPYAAIVAPGGTQQFTAIGNYSDGTTGPVAVTWTSWDSTVATINAAGQATGVKLGHPITIRATQAGISAIASLTVALPGSVWSWGLNVRGELGNGTTINSNVPVSVNGITAVSVSAGSVHSLALKADGTVSAWGSNVEGELGNGGNTSSNVPVGVNGLTGVAAIGGGYVHSMALKADGSVWAWGDNSSGVFGNGTITSSNVPVLSGINRVVAIAIGLHHNLALKSDGTVWSWGENFFGQLGNGTNTNSTVPVQVSGVGGMVAIAAGDNHSFALKSDGTVWAWGANESGELGNGTNLNTNVPVQVLGLTSVTAIASGGFNGLASASDGTVWGWGNNGEGELAIGDFNNRKTPVAIPALAGVPVVAGASVDTLALRPDGSVLVSGANFAGQLGNGSAVLSSNVPVQVVNLHGVLSISQRYLGYHNLVITSPSALLSITVTPNVTVVAPGAAQQFTAIGTFGDGSTRPVAAGWTSTDSTIASIDASGLAHGVRPGRTVVVRATVGSLSAIASLTVAVSGMPWSWGAGNFGQLGALDIVNRNHPVEVQLLPFVVSAAKGHFHSVLLRSDGTVWATGDNALGELGDGGATPFDDAPVQAKGVTGAAAVAAGYGFSLALKRDGTVSSWGTNSAGQLGIGNNTPSSLPVPVSAMRNVVAIAAGFDHSLALASDGTVWTWGSNTTGQLGDGTTTNRNAPVQVFGLTDVVAIAGGSGHSLALKSDGSVWAWGANATGELGNGNNGASPVPVRASGIAGVVAIAAGSSHSLALRSDGTVWSWGINSSGQLGIGSIINSNIPVQVTGLNNVVAIGGGTLHSLALLSDGTVKAWGDNTVGQLGNVTNDGSSVPVPVADLVGAASVGQGASGSQSFAILAIPTSLAVTPSPSTIAVGGTQRFTAIGTYIDGSTRNVTSIVRWGSLSGNVIVGAYGLVLGMRPDPGLQIYATIGSGLLFAQASLTVGSQPGGTVWDWGSGDFGELGNGTTVASNVPTAARGLDNVVSAAGGATHSLALKNDGTVWSWGGNAKGQLGNGTFLDTSTPKQVSGLSGILAIAAGFSHSVALKADGTLWTWGDNTFGQLCTGSAASSSNVPVQVSGVGPVLAISAGLATTMILRADGTVSICGINTGGQLGSGSAVLKSGIPVPVYGLVGVVAISGGGNHGLALKFDGSVWGWGGGSSGQLCNVDLANHVVPINIANLTGVTAISAGGLHSLALKQDGTAWACGDNSGGALGDGTFSNATTPVQVHNLSGVAAVRANSSHNLALTADGTVWAWGYNTRGELGSGSFSGPVNVPARVINLGGAVAIGGGGVSGHSLAVAPNTPAGTGIVVQPVSNTGTTPVKLTFGSITQTGTTSLTISTVGPPTPTGFRLGQPPVYFDLTTTAVYSGTIQVCIDFSSIVFNAARNLRIMHYEGGAWVDHTTSVDLASRIICGTVTSLSPFGLFESLADGTPPSTHAELSTPPNAAGWNNRDVTVTLTAVDNSGGSGVKQVTYSATGAQPIPSTIVTAASARFTIGTEGVTTIKFFATDIAGNVEITRSLVVRLDKTPPKIACTANPSQLWPPNNKLTTINVSVDVSDSLSGPAGFTLLSVTSNEPDSGAGDIQGWTPGTPDVTGQLRAQRSGREDGREYTLSYRATDRAMNAATCKTQVVVSHDLGK